MTRSPQDISPFWHILCVVLVMACYSDEEPSTPLDIATIKRRATDRSTTSKPGWRWGIAQHK